MEEAQKKARQLTGIYEAKMDNGVLCINKPIPVKDFIFLRNYYKLYHRVKNVMVNKRAMQRYNRFTI